MHWRWGLLCIVTALHAVSAGELSWWWLPTVRYRCEPMELVIGSQLQPQADVDGQPRQVRAQGDGGWLLPVDPQRDRRIRVVAGAEALQVQLIGPGEAQAGDLRYLSGNLIHRSDQRVLLVLDRREDQGDRRWALLTSRSRGLATSASLPQAVGWGESPLLAQIAAMPAVTLSQSLLVVLSPAEVSVAWPHRDFRQAVGFLVADARARGFRDICLVQAPVPMAEREAVEPLWAQVRDVARTHRVSVAEVATLSDHRYWQLAPGLLGPGLNAEGRQAWLSLLKPYRADTLDVSLP